MAAGHPNFSDIGHNVAGTPPPRERPQAGRQTKKKIIPLNIDDLSEQLIGPGDKEHINNLKFGSQFDHRDLNDIQAESASKRAGFGA